MNPNSAHGEKRRTILFVDDNRQLAEAREAHLTDAGYRVVLAHGVASACEALGNHLFDAIILDWMLADGTGHEILSLVKRDLPWVPCIVHSAFQSSDGQATAAGARDFVKKGDHPDELLLSLDRALQSGDLTEECAGISFSETERQFAGLVTRYFGLPEDPYSPIGMNLGSRFDFAAVKPLLRFWSKSCRPTVIDCRDFDSPESARLVLFGKVERVRSRIARIFPGALELKPFSFTVVRNVSALPDAIRTEVYSSLKEFAVKRCGAASALPVQTRIVLTAEKKMPVSKQENLTRIEAAQWFSMDDALSTPFKMFEFSWEMSKLPIYSGRHLSAAARSELRNLPEGISVSDLMRSFEKLAENGKESTQPEDLDLALLEHRVVGLMGKVRSISEARSEMERYYLRRVFSTCKGNVQQAAEMAGVKRQMIYNYVKKYDFDLKDFQE